MTDDITALVERLPEAIAREAVEFGKLNAVSEDVLARKIREAMTDVLAAAQARIATLEAVALSSTVAEAASARIAEVEKERDAARAALREIAAADSIDLALDPRWPQRIADAAISDHQTEDGRVPEGTGLSGSAPDPSVPASGFDPSRTTTFTMVFECQPDDLKGNPFHIKTPFGYPVSIGRGNAFDQLEEETAGTEWFWRIVDAAGLADLPSDEEAALRLILRRGGYSATLASAGEARSDETRSGSVEDEHATRESGGRP